MTSGKLLTCETHWSSLERPRYSPGLLLEDDDLNTGIGYTQALMRLMLRSMFGCGIVCGLKVSVVPTCKDTKRRIDVTRGVAVDGEGNLIEVTEPWQFEFGPDCDEGFSKKLWVVLCYVEQCCRPKDVACGLDDDGGSQPTRVRAGYKIKVSDHPPKCACRCRTPEDDEDEEETGAQGCCGGRTRKRQRAAALAETSSSGGQSGTDTDNEGTEDAADPCACYTDHFNGVCDCGCACRCVVLARIIDPGTIISKDDDGNAVKPHIEVDDSLVRRIRPVLNGYLACRFPKQVRGTVSEDRSTQVKADTETHDDDDIEGQMENAAARLRGKRGLPKAEKGKKDSTGNG